MAVVVVLTAEVLPQLLLPLHLSRWSHPAYWDAVAVAIPRATKPQPQPRRSDLAQALSLLLGGSEQVQHLMGEVAKAGCQLALPLQWNYRQNAGELNCERSVWRTLRLELPNSRIR